MFVEQIMQVTVGFFSIFSIWLIVVNSWMEAGNVLQSQEFVNIHLTTILRMGTSVM